MVAGALNLTGLVFVDECGLHISLAPMNGYSPKGERLRLKLPPIRVQNTTLLASMTTEGMGPSMAVNGSTTAEVFEVYLGHFLTPELQEGQVVVVDTCRRTSHREGKGVDRRERLRIIVLTQLFPRHNPVEESL
jgi:DDE superfamily endonuclease